MEWCASIFKRYVDSLEFRQRPIESAEKPIAQTLHESNCEAKPNTNAEPNTDRDV